MKKKNKKLTAFIAASSLMMLMITTLTTSHVASNVARIRMASGLSTDKFYTDYETFEQEQEDAAKLNIELAQESTTLLKNKDNMLPFPKTVKRLSVFGANNDAIFSGGGGSGSSTTDPNATLQKTLENAGYEVKPKLAALYARSTDVLEQPVSFLEPAFGSYSLYHDAAIIVISRTGSEFSDNKAYNCDGHANATDHYLSLQDNEKLLIKHVEDNFSKVVVVINSASPLELGDLQDDDKINSILWIGFTGYNGIMGFGQILNGEVAPSGRLSDIYPRDFKKDPTWNNFSDNSQVSPVLDPDTGKYVFTAKDAVTDKNGAAYKTSGWKNSYFSLEYEEGIYMGYRYYETADVEAKAGNYAGFDYDTAVVYPFGYGLSYTSFSWELVGTPGGALAKDDTATVKVKVTNTGTRAGKDVVEAYYSAPYTSGEIEKAAVNLGDFAKTGLLQPGESETVTLDIRARDMASFDYDDANGNSFVGYELESGAYKVSLRSDSHTEKLAANYTVATDIQYDKSDKTDNDIEAWFSKDNFDNSSRKNITADGAAISFTSRADFAGTFPTTPTAADLKYSDEALAYLDGQFADYAYEDKTTDPWYVAAKGTNWSQLAETDINKTPAQRGVDLASMIGVDLDDPKWDTDVLNKMTYSEMVASMNGSSRKHVGIEGIGKLEEIDDDGPAQLKHSTTGNGMAWVCEVNIASTWSKELALKQGQMVGNESLFLGITGWYGPATDTHRSPLSGRNFEYYSQDGVHGGKIAAEVIKGAQSKGMHVYLKHFALNDQEKHRGDTGGVLTWCNEQAMREIYLKSFQIAIEDGGCNGTMGAFNRIGLNPAMNYNLYINIMENEWGFKGVSDTDIGSNKWTGYDYIRCHTYPMGSVNRDGNSIEGVYNADDNMVYVAKDATEYEANKTAATPTYSLASPTQWGALRETVKRSLYTYVNSNGIKNGVSLDSFTGSTISGKVNETLSENIALEADNTNNSKEVTYNIVSGELPGGVTLGMDGTFSGKPTTSGKYTVSVQVIVDGWVKKTQDITLDIASAFKLSATTIDKDATYSGGVSSETILVSDDTSFKTVSYSLAEGKLPTGLTLNEDGSITGTATEGGVFSFKVLCTATAGSGWRVTTYYFYEDFAITVKAPAAPETATKDDVDSVKDTADGAQADADAAKAAADAAQAAADAAKAAADAAQNTATAAQSSINPTTQGIAVTGLVIGAIGFLGGAIGLVLNILGKKKM